MKLSADESILVFFALFWTIGFVPLAQYHLFETHQLNAKKLARLLVAGLILANGLPIALMVLALNWIPFLADKRAGTIGPLVVPGDVISAAVAASSLYGVRRIVHAVAVPKLYDAEDKGHEGKGGDAKTLDDFNDRWGPPEFLPHFLPGMAWLVLAFALAVLLAHGAY
jgi:hypothetical protein